MTRREAILATIHGECADRIPFYHSWRHLQTGTAERIARNRCMGVGWWRPCHTESMPNVETVRRKGPSTKDTILIEYNTPVGTVTERIKEDAGVGLWKGPRSWKGVIPWTVEKRIKKVEDYDVVKYMIEDTVYNFDDFPIKQAKGWLGDDGIIIAQIPHSPMQMLMIYYIGIPAFFTHYIKYRDKLIELYDTIAKKYEELYAVAAKSEADFVLYGDNIDSMFVSPRLFEQYFIPNYKKCAEILHEKGKLFGSHFDGKLAVLKNLISECPQDIIEAFHPPPIGDLPIQEALRVWKNKVILAGFPGSVYTMGVNATKSWLLDFLESAIPGERIALIANTELPVPDEHLLAVSSIMEKAILPLSKEKIAKIRSFEKV